MLCASEGAGEGVLDGGSPGSLCGNEPAPLLCCVLDTPHPLPWEGACARGARCHGSADGFTQGSLEVGAAPLPETTGALASAPVFRMVLLELAVREFRVSA